MGNLGNAMALINAKSSLPAVCGRVCAHERQCEGHCVLNKKGEHIHIGKLEQFISDFDSNMGLTHENILPKNRGRVAVIGSGPAGLTVAGELARKGFAVEIFEMEPEPGGVLMFGIPEYRLPKMCIRDSLGSPPVDHVAFGVEVAALVIKTVGELVAYHNADTAIVFGIACLGIIERSLKDTCGEHDFVGERVVVGIDGLRSHSPLGAVNRLAPLGELLVLVPHAHVVHILVVRELGVDLHCCVVFPLVGVAYLHCHGIKLLDGVELGVVAHPGEVDDVLAKGSAEVFNKTDHVLL